MGRERWEVLLDYAMKQLEGIPFQYTLGGGTALRLLYNHRDSNDIDIFLSDMQYLSYITPRTNDAVEAYIKDYIEAEIFTKLIFEEGEVDFIVAQNVTCIKPNIMDIGKYKIYIEDQIEIIGKKIHYRLENIKSRDIFDILTVVKYDRDKIFDYKDFFSFYIDRIDDKMGHIIDSEFIKEMEVYTVFPQGEIILTEYKRLYEDFIEIISPLN